jgi:uncharacterized membrane protein YdbT with pleckstrin-like domain
MSPAGYTDSKGHLILRPVVTKTFLKGAIGIGVFSIFLNISSNVRNYLIFLGLIFGLLTLIVLWKRQSKFFLSEDGIVIKRFLRAENTVLYSDILDVTVAQGFLARRFDCGTVYVIMKKGAGTVTVMGGGIAEHMEDVQNPNYIQELISSKMSPFTGGA